MHLDAERVAALSGDIGVVALDTEGVQAPARGTDPREPAAGELRINDLAVLSRRCRRQRRGGAGAHARYARARRGHVSKISFAVQQYRVQRRLNHLSPVPLDTI